MTETTLYKVLGPKGQPIYGGKGIWARPSGKRPGKWMPEVKHPLCCERGYHLVELWSLTEWLTADCTIYVAEGRGASHADGTGKTAFAQARLLRRVHLSECDMRLFAADCAEHVLPIFLKVRPDDDRPAKATEAARQFARGEIGAAARDAAGDAAWDAAGDAAGDAARDATRAAARDAARAAARAAAGDATGAAARAATRAAARDAARRDAERQWQAERLATYITDSQT
jgi:hypothetical protein